MRTFEILVRLDYKENRHALSSSTPPPTRIGQRLRAGIQTCPQGRAKPSPFSYPIRPLCWVAVLGKTLEWPAQRVNSLSPFPEFLSS